MITKINNKNWVRNFISGVFYLLLLSFTPYQLRGHAQTRVRLGGV